MPKNHLHSRTIMNPNQRPEDNALDEELETPLAEDTEEFDADVVDDSDTVDPVDIDEIAPLVLATVPRREVATLDPLHIYLQEIKKFKPLELDEEFDLARRYRDEKEEQAAFILITSNLRLVVKIAMDFQRRWMKNVLDLIQEGNVGLMKAVQKFDPDKGIKFSYYASFGSKPTS